MLVNNSLVPFESGRHQVPWSVHPPLLTKPAQLVEILLNSIISIDFIILSASMHSSALWTTRISFQPFVNNFGNFGVVDVFSRSIWRNFINFLQLSTTILRLTTASVVQGISGAILPDQFEQPRYRTIRGSEDSR
jgi:hypothetical protein